MKKTIIVFVVLILAMSMMVGCVNSCKVTDRVAYSLGGSDNWNYQENIREFAHGEDLYMRYKATIVMDNTKKPVDIEMYVLFEKNENVSIEYLGDAKLISLDNSDESNKYNFIVQAKSQDPQEFMGTFKLRAKAPTTLKFTIVFGETIETSNDRQGVIEFS